MPWGQTTLPITAKSYRRYDRSVASVHKGESVMGVCQEDFLREDDFRYLSGIINSLRCNPSSPHLSTPNSQSPLLSLKESSEKRHQPTTGRHNLAEDKVSRCVQSQSGYGGNNYHHVKGNYEELCCSYL